MSDSQNPMSDSDRTYEAAKKALEYLEAVVAGREVKNAAIQVEAAKYLLDNGPVIAAKLADIKRSR